MWYNGKAVCMNETIKSKWSVQVHGITTGSIRKAYARQEGECKFYDGRAKKQV